MFGEPEGHLLAQLRWDQGTVSATAKTGALLMQLPAMLDASMQACPLMSLSWHYMCSIHLDCILLQQNLQALAGAPQACTGSQAGNLTSLRLCLKLALPVRAFPQHYPFLICEQAQSSHQ